MKNILNVIRGFVGIKDDSGNVVDTVDDNGVRRFAVDVHQAAGDDERVKVSSNDAVSDYLKNKVTATEGSNTTNILELTELNDGLDEDLQFQIDETKINHDNLEGFVGNEHIDWTQPGAGTIDPSNYADNDTIYTHPNHTGEVTSVGDGAQALDKTAITNKTTIPADGADFILVADTSDSSNLKKVLLSDLLDSDEDIESINQSFLQTSHGLAVGDVVRYASGLWVKAQADTEANSEAIAIVSAVADVNNFTVCYHGRITGLTGLTADCAYFLSDVTAGGVTDTSPTISKPIFYSTSTTEAVVNIMRALTTAEPTSIIEVQDEGVSLTLGVTKFNFVGDGVTATEPVANEITVTIPGGGGGVTAQIFKACQFDNPSNSDWAVNALAPAAADSNNNALTVRRFDDTTQEGIGFLLDVPSSASNVTFNFRSRAETANIATRVAKVGLFEREIPDNGTITAWSSIIDLVDISIPSNENFQYDSITKSLATLGLTAGSTHQFELVRYANHTSDTLAGDWSLLQMSVEFS